MVQNTQTVIVSYQPTYNGTCEVTYDDGEVIQRQLSKDVLIKLNNKDFELSVPNNMAWRHTYGEGIRGELVDVEGGVPIVEIMGRDETPVIRYVDPQTTSTGLGLHGVLMNYNGTWTSFGRMHVKKPEWRICGSVVLLQTRSEKESAKLLDYLATNEVQSICKTCKRSFANSKYLFRLIPDAI